MSFAISRRVLVGQLIGIFLIALGVRLWGIDFGLPYGQIPDETADITTSFQIARGQLPTYPFHRVAWPLLQLPLHGVHFAALKLTNSQYSLADFEATYYTQRSTFIMTARIAMALLCALCIIPLYAIGYDLTERHTGGLLSALVFAVHPAQAYLAHTGLPDALATVFAAISLWAALRIARTGQPRWYIIGGLATALALLLRLQLVTIGGALLVGHLVYGLRQAPTQRSLVVTRLGWLIAGGLIGLVVFNPLFVLDPAAVLKDFQFILSERLVGTYQNDAHAQTSLANSFYNLQQNLMLPVIFMRPIVMLGAFLGIVFGVLNRNIRVLIVVVFACFALPILTTPGPRITFWLGLAIPCAALVSYAVISLAAYPRGRRPAAAMAVIVVAWCSVETIKINTVFSQPTTQELAYEYITTQWPAETAILEGDPFVYSVPLSRTVGSMERIAAVESLPASYDFFLKNPDLIRQPAYDVYGSEYRTEIESEDDLTQFLADNAIEYVIEVEWCQGQITYGNLSDLTFPLITPAVLDSLTLVQTFSPFAVDTCVQPIENRTHMEYMRLWEWVRPGPIIRLYSVK